MKILSMFKNYLAYAILFGIIYISSYGLYFAYDNVGIKEKNNNITTKTFNDNTKVPATVLTFSPYTLKDTPAQHTTKSNIYGSDTQATNSNDSKNLAKLFENLDETQNNYISINSEGKQNGEKYKDINKHYSAADSNDYNILNQSLIPKFNTDNNKNQFQTLNPKNKEDENAESVINTKNMEIVMESSPKKAVKKMDTNHLIKIRNTTGKVDNLFEKNSSYQFKKKEIDKNKIQTKILKKDTVHKNSQLDKLYINSVVQNLDFTENFHEKNQIQMQDTSKTPENTSIYKDTVVSHTVKSSNVVNYTNYIDTALNFQEFQPICNIDNKYIRCKNFKNAAQESIDLDISTICKKKLGKIVSTNVCTNETNKVIKRKYPPCSTFMCKNDKIEHDLFHIVELSSMIHHNALQKYDFTGIQKHGHFTDIIYVKTTKTHAFGVNIKDCSPIYPINMPLEYIDALSLHKYISVRTFDQLIPLFSASYKSALFVYQEDYYSYLAFHKNIKGDDGFSIILTDWQNKVKSSNLTEFQFYNDYNNTIKFGSFISGHIRNSDTAALYDFFWPFHIGCIDGLIKDEENKTENQDSQKDHAKFVTYFHNNTFENEHIIIYIFKMERI